MPQGSYATELKKHELKFEIQVQLSFNMTRQGRRRDGILDTYENISRLVSLIRSQQTLGTMGMHSIRCSDGHSSYTEVLWDSLLEVEESLPSHEVLLLGVFHLLHIEPASLHCTRRKWQHWVLKDL